MARSRATVVPRLRDYTVFAHLYLICAFMSFDTRIGGGSLKIEYLKNSRDFNNTIKYFSLLNSPKHRHGAGRISSELLLLFSGLFSFVFFIVYFVVGHHLYYGIVWRYFWICFEGQSIDYYRGKNGDYDVDVRQEQYGNNVNLGQTATRRNVFIFFSGIFCQVELKIFNFRCLCCMKR